MINAEITATGAGMVANFMMRSDLDAQWMLTVVSECDRTLVCEGASVHLV